MSVEDDADVCKKLVEVIQDNRKRNCKGDQNVDRKEIQNLETRVRGMETELATSSGDIHSLKCDIHTLQVQQAGCT